MSELSEKQRFALDLVLSGHNVMISGSAGTGKSFLISEIVKRCRGEGKRVSLTCTTGIACAVYTDVQAQTIHHWSGINDGRYSPSEMRRVLENNPNYSNVLERVKNTDVLVIDECSMLSKKMFDCLSEICAIKNESLIFGGIHLVLCGDFLQLAPVPNALCNEDGDYCFNSDLFSKMLKHRVTLTEVFRQSEEDLITAINEVSTGSPSADTLAFMNGLKRPLSDDHTTSTKLFSTKNRVDDFNRDSLIEFPGPVYEFVSHDSGEKRHLSHILAPHVLWLKIGAPVILLRNLSDKLVNGLMGKVHDVQNGTVVVDFPSLNMMVPMQKTKFSVHSRRENKDIAVREQVPIKLAFALTIHKSQGMTLDRVEVDCTGIFKPGQLGVAMGRVTSSEGLRIINFNMRACMSQPDSVKAFNAEGSIEPEEDKTCCQIKKSSKENPAFFTVQEALEIGLDPDIDMDCEAAFDEEFEEIIRTIDENENGLKLPEEIDLNDIKMKMKVEDPVTTFQFNTNKIVDSLHETRLLSFCQKEYQCLVLMAEKLKCKKDAVKCADQGNFYSAVHSHYNSTEFTLKCMMLFEGENFTAEHKHVCYNIAVELRKCVVNKKAEVFTSTTMNLTNRSVTNASRARIRYIGGYCIAKVRAKFMTKKETLRYAKTASQQQLYEEAAYTTSLLNSLREDEQYIVSNSTEPDSLLDVLRKQNANRGLTNISDETYLFFIKLADQCLSLLTDKNIHKYGNTMFEVCRKKISDNESLVQHFNELLKDHAEHYCELSNKKSNVDKDSVAQTLFQKILKLYLLVLFGQFRKDILDAFKITKKMAHRKQIQVSKSSEYKAKKVPASNDSGEGVKKSVKRKKVVQSSSHTEDDTQTQESSLLEQAGPSDTVTEQAGPSDTVTVQAGASDNQPCSDAEVLCEVCHTEDEGQWIQCDKCLGWYHRHCASIKHHMTWKKLQKPGSVYHCRKCN